MGRSVGYVGTLLVETRGTDRVWFALTQADSGSEWVTVDHRPGSPRAWFTMNLEPGDSRPVELAKLALLIDAQRERQHVVVGHPDNPHPAGTINMERGQSDTFDAETVRSLRVGLHA